MRLINALNTIKGIVTSPLATVAFMSNLISAYGVLPQACAFFMTVLDTISLTDDFSSYDQLQRAFYHFLFCICKATKPECKLEAFCKEHSDPFEMMIMMTFFKFEDEEDITIAKCWARKIRCLWYRYIKARKGEILLTRVGLLGPEARNVKPAFRITTTEALNVHDKYIIATEGSENQAISSETIEKVFSKCGWSLAEDHPNNSTREGGNRIPETEESSGEATDPEDHGRTIIPDTGGESSHASSTDESPDMVSQLLAMPPIMLQGIINSLMDEAYQEGRYDEIRNYFPAQQPSYDEIVESCLVRRLLWDAHSPDTWGLPPTDPGSHTICSVLDREWMLAKIKTTTTAATDAYFNALKAADFAQAWQVLEQVVTTALLARLNPAILETQLTEMSIEQYNKVQKLMEDKVKVELNAIRQQDLGNELAEMKRLIKENQTMLTQLSGGTIKPISGNVIPKPPVGPTPLHPRTPEKRQPVIPSSDINPSKKNRLDHFNFD